MSEVIEGQRPVQVVRLEKDLASAGVGLRKSSGSSGRGGGGGVTYHHTTPSLSTHGRDFERYEKRGPDGEFLGFEEARRGTTAQKQLDNLADMANPDSGSYQTVLDRGDPRAHEVDWQGREVEFSDGKKLVSGKVVDIAGTTLMVRSGFRTRRVDWSEARLKE